MTPSTAFLLPTPALRLAWPRPHTRHRSPVCTTTLPANYIELRQQATEATQVALDAGLSLLEVQFPPVPNMATAALNELLDANRVFTRDFLMPFAARRAPNTVVAVFPDRAEARLAAEAYGRVPFAVAAIPPTAPPYVDLPDGLVTVVNPGFNVDEWINMRHLHRRAPLLTLNADLDKVRSGYYPRLFYPKLHKAKVDFLTRFEPVYYVKQLSNGGTLFRAFPEPWTLFYLPNKNGARQEVLWTGESRPEFVVIQRMLAARRVEEQMAR